MPRKAQRAEYPNRLYNIVLRVTGKEKNKILKAAKKENLTLSEYILYAVWVLRRNKQGIPPPTTAKHELPNFDAQMRSYLSGELLLQPCGERVCDMSVVEVGSMSFCETCNVRIG